jgi:pimeloyl-ACP methyl ester carboxylesterase
MSVVFVHGSPDRAGVWKPLIAQLDRDDALALELPGFGCEPPEGFDATRWAYRDWLVAQLEQFEHPPDLVAHDIGAVIAHGVLLERPDLVRTWALGNSAHADYVWEHARPLQTTRIGEERVELFLSLEPDQQQQVVALMMGVDETRAAELAANMDRRQMTCALAFYRSVTWVGDWQLNAQAVYPPGLVLWGEADRFQSVEFAERLAADGGAELRVFPDTGHWWQLERPGEAAAALTEFWATPT